MSMPALYVLADEFRAAAEQLADLDLPAEVVADTLESLSGDLELKATNVAAFFLSLEATAKQIKAAEEQMATRRKAIEARAASIRAYLMRCMQTAGVSKIESPHFRLTVRVNPPAVDVFDAQQVPAIYWCQPEPPAPTIDNKAVAEDIKAGVDVPGARMVRGQRLDVR